MSARKDKQLLFYRETLSAVCNYPNIYRLLTMREVKMPGYCPISFYFACLRTSGCQIQRDNVQRDNVQPS